MATTVEAALSEGQRQPASLTSRSRLRVRYGATSLLAQCNERIDPRRTQRREYRGTQRDDHQRHSDDAEGRRIVRPDAEELTGHEALGCNREHDAAGQSDTD